MSKKSLNSLVLDIVGTRVHVRRWRDGDNIRFHNAMLYALQGTTRSHTDEVLHRFTKIYGADLDSMVGRLVIHGCQVYGFSFFEMAISVVDRSFRTTSPGHLFCNLCGCGYSAEWRVLGETCLDSSSQAEDVDGEPLPCAGTVTVFAANEPLLTLLRNTTADPEWLEDMRLLKREFDRE
jgi:hypothetical protein